MKGGITESLRTASLVIVVLIYSMLSILVVLDAHDARLSSILPIFSRLHYLSLLPVTFSIVPLTALYFIFSEIAVQLHTTDLLCCVGFLCLSFVASFRRQSSILSPCLDKLR